MIPIDRFDYLLFDFDGVIKESNLIKGEVFKKIFKDFGPEVTSKIFNHHISNGGISRYEKIPLYLSWAGIKNNKNIKEFEKLFSELVVREVIASEWVPGVENFIREQYSHGKKLFIVSATPTFELKQIIRSIGLENFFHELMGSPAEKSDNIKSLITKKEIVPKKSIFFGDTHTDFNAANLNSIGFVLRKTTYNNDITRLNIYDSINDFR